MRFEELIADEANDKLTPEQIFLTAVDDALAPAAGPPDREAHPRRPVPDPAGLGRGDQLQEGRGITPVRMKRYAAHEWRQNPTNLLVISPTGGGKTYLACAIGIAACHSGHTVAYTRMDELARRLVIARGDGIGHQKLLNELSDVDLLVIDDFLTVGIDPEAANDLFAVLANREHRCHTHRLAVRPNQLGRGPPGPGRGGLDREPAGEQRPPAQPRRRGHAQAPRRQGPAQPGHWE